MSSISVHVIQDCVCCAVRTESVHVIQYMSSISVHVIQDCVCCAVRTESVHVIQYMSSISVHVIQDCVCCAVRTESVHVIQYMSSISVHVIQDCVCCAVRTESVHVIQYICPPITLHIVRLRYQMDDLLSFLNICVLKCMMILKRRQKFGCSVEYSNVARNICVSVFLARHISQEPNSSQHLLFLLLVSSDQHTGLLQQPCLLAASVKCHLLVVILSESDLW